MRTRWLYWCFLTARQRDYNRPVRGRAGSGWFVVHNMMRLGPQAPEISSARFTRTWPWNSQESVRGIIGEADLARGIKEMRHY